MEILNNLETKIKKIFGEGRKKNIPWIFLMGCIGIILIFISDIIPKENNIRKEAEIPLEYENYDYEKELEKRLEEEISKIKGAGKTSVMLTADSSKEYSYAENSSKEKDEKQEVKENEIVIIEGKNGEEPLVIKTKEARIRGVLVICEGGDNAMLREKIIEAVCALLDIPSNKVSIAKMA